MIREIIIIVKILYQAFDISYISLLGLLFFTICKNKKIISSNTEKLVYIIFRRIV